MCAKSVAFVVRPAHEAAFALSWAMMGMKFVE
jgi:hypothetical protein